jgi:hypothetical protein
LYFSFSYIAQKDLSKGYSSWSLANEVWVTTPLIDKKIFRNGLGLGRVSAKKSFF